MSVNF